MMENTGELLHFSTTNNVKLKLLRQKTKKITDELILQEAFPFAKLCETTILTHNEKDENPNENTKLQIKQPVNRQYLTNERITAIKKEVEEAIRQHKIFYLCGHFRSVKRALLKRGWIEKIQVKSPTKSTNDFTQLDDSSRNENDALFQNLPTQQAGEPLDQHLKKCEMAIKARLLQSHPANLYWNIRKESLTWLNAIPRDALINRFPKVRFTSKESLCSILQQMHWFTEPGVAMINFPRCYNLSYPDQLVSFIDDFRLTACTSLLKNFLAAIAHDGESAVRSIAGSLSISVVHFAIDRCLEYISTAEHKDLDIEFRKIWDHEWENFFASFDAFVYQKKRFLHRTGDESIDELKERITHALKKMIQYWPQYNLDGMRNIWIVKPGNRCRGQGIILMDKSQSILGLVLNCNPKKHRYIVQKYVERPFLIYDTKFDIRQWFLLTSGQPLIVWMYTECYLRFSSQLFSLTDFHEAIHLTNNAVQKRYKNQQNQQRSKELPDENMWDCYTFKAYLRKIGQYEKWDNFIYPAMKQAIVGTMLASQDTMDRKGNYFELYGADFILGQDLVPWLLEINSSPDMSSSTSVTARMCPQCLEDVIKVVIDRREDPTADTGLFELAYKQPCPRPPTYLGLQLTIRGKRMSRHKVVKNSRPIENVNITHENFEKLSISSSVQDYQGPIIGDLIEELKQESHTLLKDGDSEKQIYRRKKVGSVRKNRTLKKKHRKKVNVIQATGGVQCEIELF